MSSTTPALPRKHSRRVIPLWGLALLPASTLAAFSASAGRSVQTALGTANAADRIQQEQAHMIQELRHEVHHLEGLVLNDGEEGLHDLAGSKTEKRQVRRHHRRLGSNFSDHRLAGCKKEKDACEQDDECCEGAKCRGKTGFKKCQHELLTQGEYCEASREDHDDDCGGADDQLKCRGAPGRKQCQAPLEAGSRCEWHPNFKECKTDGGIDCRGPHLHQLCQKPLPKNFGCSWRKPGTGSDCAHGLRCSGSEGICVQVCFKEEESCENHLGRCCEGKCVGRVGQRVCKKQLLPEKAPCEWVRDGHECDASEFPAMDCRGPPGSKVCTKEALTFGAACEKSFFGKECAGNLICAVQNEHDSAGVCKDCAGAGDSCSAQGCCEGFACDTHAQKCVKEAAEGETCIKRTAWDNCASGFTCTKGSRGEWECSEFCRAEGGHCVKSSDCCGDSAMCLGAQSKKKCRNRLLTEGEACHGHGEVECAAHLRCTGPRDNKFCTRPLTEGKECDMHAEFNECDGMHGLVCRGETNKKTCQYRVDLGKPCDPWKPNECQQGLICNKKLRICQDKIYENQFCEDVGKGLVCETPGRCVGPKGAKRCRMGPLQLAESCSSTEDCDKGLACDGVTQKCLAICLAESDRCTNTEMPCCKKGERRTTKTDLGCHGPFGLEYCQAPLAEGQGCSPQREGECEEGFVCDKLSHKCVSGALGPGAKCEGRQKGYICDAAQQLSCRGSTNFKTCQGPLEPGATCDPDAPDQECKTGYACHPIKKRCEASATCCVCRDHQVVWSPDNKCEVCKGQFLHTFAAPKDCIDTGSSVTSCSKNCQENIEDSLKADERVCKRIGNRKDCEKVDCYWLGNEWFPKCQSKLKLSMCKSVNGQQRNGLESQEKACTRCSNYGCKYRYFKKECVGYDYENTPFKSLVAKDAAQCRPEGWYKGIAGEDDADELRDCMEFIERTGVGQDAFACVGLFWRQALIQQFSHIGEPTTSALVDLPPSVYHSYLETRRLNMSLSGSWFQEDGAHLKAVQKGNRVLLTGRKLPHGRSLAVIHHGRTGSRRTVWLQLQGAASRQLGRRALITSHGLVFEGDRKAFVRRAARSSLLGKFREERSRRLSRACRGQRSSGCYTHYTRLFEKWWEKGSVKRDEMLPCSMFKRRALELKKSFDRDGRCEATEYRALDSVGRSLIEKFRRIRADEDVLASLRSGRLKAYVLEGQFRAATADGRYVIYRFPAKSGTFPSNLMSMIKDDALYAHLKQNQESLLQRPLALLNAKLPKIGIFGLDEDADLLLMSAPAVDWVNRERQLGWALDPSEKGDSSTYTAFMDPYIGAPRSLFRRQKLLCQTIPQLIDKDVKLLQTYAPSGTNSVLGWSLVIGTEEPLQDCDLGVKKTVFNANKRCIGFAISNYWKDGNIKDIDRMFQVQFTKEKSWQWSGAVKRMLAEICYKKSEGETEEERQEDLEDNLVRPEVPGSDSTTLRPNVPGPDNPGGGGDGGNGGRGGNGGGGGGSGDNGDAANGEGDTSSNEEPDQPNKDDDKFADKEKCNSWVIGSLEVKTEADREMYRMSCMSAMLRDSIPADLGLKSGASEEGGFETGGDDGPSSNTRQQAEANEEAANEKGATNTAKEDGATNVATENPNTNTNDKPTSSGLLQLGEIDGDGNVDVQTAKRHHHHHSQHNEVMADLSGSWSEGYTGHPHGPHVSVLQQGSKVVLEGSALPVQKMFGVLVPGVDGGHAELRMQSPASQAGRVATVSGNRIVFDDDDAMVLTKAAGQSASLLESASSSSDVDDIADWDKKTFEPAVCKHIKSLASTAGLQCWKKSRACKVTALGRKEFKKLRHKEAQVSEEFDGSLELYKSLDEGPLQPALFWSDKHTTYMKTKDERFLVIFDSAMYGGDKRADNLKDMITGTGGRTTLLDHFKKNKDSLLLRVYGLYRLTFFRSKVSELKCSSSEGALSPLEREEYFVTVIRHPTYGYMRKYRGNPDVHEVTLDVNAAPEKSRYEWVYKMQTSEVWKGNGMTRQEWDKVHLQGKPHTVYDWEARTQKLMLSEEDCASSSDALVQDLSYLQSYHRKRYSLIFGVVKQKQGGDQLAQCQPGMLCFKSFVEEPQGEEPAKKKSKKSSLVDTTSLDGEDDSLMERDHSVVASKPKTAGALEHAYTTSIFYYWEDGSRKAVEGEPGSEESDWKGTDTYVGNSLAILEDSCGGEGVYSSNEDAEAGAKTTKPGEESSFILYYVIPGVALLCLVGVIAWFMMSRGSGGSGSQQQQQQQQQQQPAYPPPDPARILPAKTPPTRNDGGFPVGPPVQGMAVAQSSFGIGGPSGMAWTPPPLPPRGMAPPPTFVSMNTQQQTNYQMPAAPSGFGSSGMGMGMGAGDGGMMGAGAGSVMAVQQTTVTTGPVGGVSLGGGGMDGMGGMGGMSGGAMDTSMVASGGAVPGPTPEGGDYSAPTPPKFDNGPP